MPKTQWIKQNTDELYESKQLPNEGLRAMDKTDTDGHVFESQKQPNEGLRAQTTAHGHVFNVFLISFLWFLLMSRGNILSLLFNAAMNKYKQKIG